jgi:hypothetical protein
MNLSTALSPPLFACYYNYHNMNLIILTTANKKDPNANDPI